MKCPICSSEFINNSCPKCGYNNIKANNFDDVPLKKKNKILDYINRKFFKILVIIIILIIIINLFITNQTKLNRITSPKEIIKDKTSFQYVNDLYILDGLYYENILNNDKKNI